MSRTFIAATFAMILDHFAETVDLRKSKFFLNRIFTECVI